MIDLRSFARTSTSPQILDYLNSTTNPWIFDNEENTLLDYLIYYKRNDLINIVLDMTPPLEYLENALDYTKDRIRLFYAIKNSPSRRNNHNIYRHFTEEIDDMKDIKEMLEEEIFR